MTSLDVAMRRPQWSFAGLRDPSSSPSNCAAPSPMSPMPGTGPLSPSFRAGAPKSATASQACCSSDSDTIVSLLSRGSTPETSIPRPSPSAPGPATPCLLYSSIPAATENTQRTPCPHAKWRKVQSFVRAVCSSSLLASALAAVDVRGHPAVGDGELPRAASDLQWTLAGMLELFLRSDVRAPSEEFLLAALWTLESWGDAHSSPATKVLGRYVRHLAAFDPARARLMAAKWREAFTRLRAAVVAAQMELLEGVEWRLRLTDEQVANACRLLFGEQSDTASSTSAAQLKENVEAWAAGAAAASAYQHRRWKDPAGACAAAVSALCARVAAESTRIRSEGAQKPPTESASRGSFREGEDREAKRFRHCD